MNRDLIRLFVSYLDPESVIRFLLVAKFIRRAFTDAEHAAFRNRRACLSLKRLQEEFKQNEAKTTMVRMSKDYTNRNLLRKDLKLVCCPGCFNIIHAKGKTLRKHRERGKCSNAQREATCTRCNLHCTGSGEDRRGPHTRLFCPMDESLVFLCPKATSYYIGDKRVPEWALCLTNLHRYLAYEKKVYQFSGSMSYHGGCSFSGTEYQVRQHLKTCKSSYLLFEEEIKNRIIISRHDPLALLLRPYVELVDESRHLKGCEEPGFCSTCENLYVYVTHNNLYERELLLSKVL